jgi:hypothetical protein
MIKPPDKAIIYSCKMHNKTWKNCWPHIKILSAKIIYFLNPQILVALNFFTNLYHFDLVQNKIYNYFIF